MAKLHKLSICGIRSFGPSREDVQVVQFKTPVTLILGENGSGKTTIIESLKYACTGELPSGSNSGQGFVNDPKLNSSAFTKGCIKLQITDSQGNSVVITKAVRVEQKSRSALKFSSMDSSIEVTKPNGERLPLSSRCADINVQACSFMGVPKAILNNVIFCHQENSLWPLEDGKKLKEKFDEIFDSSRYNTCIDSIRKLIKNETEKLKTETRILSFKKDIKEAVERNSAKLEEKEEKLNSFEEEIVKVQQALGPIKERIDEICNLLNTLADIQEKYATRVTEKNYLDKLEEDLLKKLKREEFPGDDGELTKAISSFDENYEACRSQINDIEKRNQVLEEAQEDYMGLVQKLQVRLGQLQQEKNHQKKLVEARNDLISGTAMQLVLQVPSLDNGDDDVKDIMERFQQKLEEEKVKLDVTYNNFETGEKTLQNNIDLFKEDIVKIEQKIKSNQEQISEHDNKSKEIGVQLKKLDLTSDKITKYDKDIESIENNLKNLNDNFDGNSISNNIDRKKQEIRTLEDDLDNAEKEYKILQKNDIVRNDIDIRSGDIQIKEHEIEELLLKHSADFEYIFDQIPETNLKEAAENCQELNKSEFTKLTKSLNDAKQHVNDYENKLRFLNQKLQHLETELKENEQKILKTTQGNEFKKIYSDTEVSIEKLHKKRGILSSANIMYEKFIDEFQDERACCPICETDFKNNESKVGQVVLKLRNKIQGLPDKITDLEQNLKKGQQLFNELQQLTPLYEKNEHFRVTDIPTLQSEIKTSSEKLSTVQFELSDLEEEIVVPQKKLEICSKIMGSAALVDKNRKDTESFKNTILELRSQLVNVISNKTKEQVESDIEMTKINLTDLRRTCETDQKKLDVHKAKCQDLRENKNKIHEMRLQLQQSIQDKPHLLEQQKEILQKIRSLNMEMPQLKAQLSPLVEKLRLEIKKLDEMKLSHKQSMDTEKTKLNKIETSYEDIVKHQKVIEDSYSKNLDGEFDGVLERYSSAQEKIKGLNKDKKDLANELDKLKKLQAGREFEKRTLEDNLELRNNRKHCSALNDEITELKKQRGEYDHNSLHRENQKIETKRSSLISKIHSVEGQKEELQLSIDELKAELNKPENKRAYKIYKEKVFEIKVMEKGIADLKLYVQGVENAIIEFHKEKMLKINKVIKHLWRNVYRGNDIDYIQIKTEESTSTASKRMYNYKVVQIKSDIELEMKGRCSAGQKVLACLIIRIALAEIFSHNCGILALDEPTTNLDKENILSLSEALVKMINTRTKEKNFQLIIITHDEDFIRSLFKVESVSTFLRVKRNYQGKSVINREVC